MAEVLITYKAENESLQAVVKETVKGNVAIAESATKAGQVASKAYKDAANSAKAAFGSQEVKKSLDNQVASIDKLAKGSISLKTQLKNLKAEISALDDAGKSGTKQFNQLAISAAKLEDQIGDTQERVKVLASDTFKFDAAIGAVKGLAAGFAVAQGAVGLFAKDNEELQMAIAKTNSAIAILTGLQEIANIVTGQGAAKLGIITAAQALYTTVVGTSTGALRVFRIALAATGIGLLIAGVGLLVSYLSNLSDESEKAAKDIEAFNVALKDSQKSINEYNKDVADAALKLRVLNKEISESTANKIKIVAETYGKLKGEIIAQVGALGKLKNAQITLTEKRKEDEEALRKNYSGANDALKSNIAESKRLENENIERIRKGEQAIVDLKKAAAEKIKKETAVVDTEEQIKIQEEAAKKSEEARKKAEEARKKALEDAAKAREKLLQLENDVFKSSLDEQSKILDDSNNQILELEKTFRESKFKKGSAEEIAAQKALQLSIEEIKKQATAKNIELEKQSQEKILAAKLEAAKAGDNATLQVILASLETQQKLELESAETLGKSKLEITTRYGLLIANVNKQIAEANVNTQVNNLKRLEIVEGTSLKRRIELIEIAAEKRKLDAANSIKDEKERASAIKLIDAETQQAKTTETKTETQKQLDLILQYADAVGKTLTSINDLQKQLSENRIAEINTEKEAQLNAINESFDTERSKIRQRAALELRANRAIAAEKTKQAKADKALALFNIALSTAQAVAAGLKLTVGAPAFIAFAIALGAIQAATVLAKPIPKFAQGGVVGGQLHSQGGTQIEAEKDEYIVKRSQSVKHRKELDAINTSTQAFRNMINERYVRPAIMNYVLNRKQEQGVTVNASLNSKAMESELRGLRKDIRNSRVRSINNQLDSRYTWQ